MGGGFFLLVAGVGMGAGSGAVVPTIPGLEYRVHDERLHYRTTDERMHFAVEEP